MWCCHLPFTFYLLLLSRYTVPTLADTEIINLSAGNSIPVAPLPENWTALHAGANEIIVLDRKPAPLLGDPRDPLCGDNEDVHPFKRRPCPHELWLALDLDGDGDGNVGWRSYDQFTLRVSWPASHPAQVAVSLYSPALPPGPSARTARMHLARIRLTQQGIRAPNHAGLGAQQGEERGDDNGDGTVPLVVLLEPLVLGVLPASVVPIAATVLVVLGAVAYGVLPRILVRLGEVVESAREELEALEERKGR